MCVSLQAFTHPSYRRQQTFVTMDTRTQAQWWCDTAPGGINPFADGLLISGDEPVVPDRAEARAMVPHAFRRESDQSCHLVKEPVRSAYPVRSDQVFNVGAVVHQWWAPWFAAGPLNPVYQAPVLTPLGAQLRDSPAWYPAEVVSCMGLCVILYAGAWHREQVYRLHMPPYVRNRASIQHMWEGPMELVPARYLRRPTFPLLSLWADQPVPPPFWESYLAAVTDPYLRNESYPGIIPNFLTLRLIPSVPPMAVPDPHGSLVCVLFDFDELTFGDRDEEQTRRDEDFLLRMRRTEIEFGPGNDPARQAHTYVAYGPRDVPGENEIVLIGTLTQAVTIRPFRSLMLFIQNVLLPPSEFDDPTAVPSSMDGQSSSSADDVSDED